jgi:acetyl esterase/lipase
MVMGDRPDVATAPWPVAAVDTVGLAEQLVVALARVPFRQPFEGPSGPLQNAIGSVTREVVRTLMGNLMSLPIDEFRSVEKVLDDVCRKVMPPVVARIGAASEQRVVGGVPGLWYQPEGHDPHGVIVYLHGGGYIGTSPTMYAAFTAHLCRATGCAVFVADYRLAPEFPYPAGVEDAAAVVLGLVEQGTPATQLFIAGDSGGGGLTNSLLLAEPFAKHGITPAGLLLFSPEVDLRLDQPSVTENAGRDLLPWNIPTNAYVHGADDAEQVVDSDLADLSGFPPVFVSWGGAEMFRDAIRAFVAQLDQVGDHHVGHEEPGMFHVFPILMPWADASRRVLAAAGTFVRRALPEDAGQLAS